jgi:hypothetical protein
LLAAFVFLLGSLSGTGWSGDQIAQGNLLSSWPGLSRPSTPFLPQGGEDVDARHKTGHDEFRRKRHAR